MVSYIWLLHGAEMAAKSGRRFRSPLAEKLARRSFAPLLTRRDRLGWQPTQLQADVSSRS